jgi:hypothetical protein
MTALIGFTLFVGIAIGCIGTVLVAFMLHVIETQFDTKRHRRLKNGRGGMV